MLRALHMSFTGLFYSLGPITLALNPKRSVLNPFVWGPLLSLKSPQRPVPRLGALSGSFCGLGFRVVALGVFVP